MTTSRTYWLPQGSMRGSPRGSISGWSREPSNKLEFDWHKLSNKVPLQSSMENPEIYPRRFPHLFSCGKGSVGHGCSFVWLRFCFTMAGQNCLQSFTNNTVWNQSRPMRSSGCGVSIVYGRNTSRVRVIFGCWLWNSSEDSLTQVGPYKNLINGLPYKALWGLIKAF